MNRLIYIFCFLLFTILFSCKSIDNYEKVNDIFIEKISPDQINIENKYDLDNKIYKVGRIFKFEVEFKNTSDELLKEKFIEFEILGGTKPFSDFDTSYSQTVMKIKYLDKNNILLASEKTGIIENEINTWVHPPRSNRYQILQLNSFPFFIKSDVNKKKWSWQLECSYDIYKNVLINHKYFQRKVSNTPKEGDRYIIKSFSKSTAGENSSIFEFSNFYGFTKLLFFNYDKSFFSFKLISIKEQDGTYFFKK